MRSVQVLARRLRTPLKGIRWRLRKLKTRARRAVHGRLVQGTGFPFATAGRTLDRSVSELVDLFFDLVERVQPDLFVEAGAKEASASRRARELQVPRVVAFEASPVTHKRFAGRNSAIEYVNVALSDEPGTIGLNIGVNEEGALRSDGRASLLQRTSSVDVAPVRIPCTTLDTFFGDHEFQSVALWIDVEGATGQVFTGGRSVLDRASVVIVEVEDRPFWKGQWLVDEVLTFLHGCGLVPVARDHQSVHQYNVVLVRSTLMAEVQDLIASTPPSDD